LGVTAWITVAGQLLPSEQAATFFYYPAKQAAVFIRPGTGPIGGGTEVLLSGADSALASGPFACRFGLSETPATAVLQDRALRCVTPASIEQSVPIEVTLNGQQYHSHDDLVFSFHTPPQMLSISPASGTVEGETKVTIAGAGFIRTPHVACQWGLLTTAVIDVNASHITCASPPSGAGASVLEITLNGQQYTSNGFIFSRYLHPHVLELSIPGEEGDFGSWLAAKVTLPHSRFVMVRASGSGFSGGTDYRCLINDAFVIAATYDDHHDCIECWSDLWVEGENVVEVTLNGVEYTADRRTLVVNRYW
jgi:hypothetical protein